MQRLWRYTFAKTSDEWNKLYTNKMKWENNYTAYFDTDQIETEQNKLYVVQKNHKNFVLL